MPPPFDDAWSTAMIAAVVTWLISVGCCVGSFLNVVIYRGPLGLSVVRPGSFCPKCKHAIRWQHNVPVLGWLMLRGKCYDCGVRISARYPVVEFLVGALFGGLAWVEIVSPGSASNLGPPRTVPLHSLESFVEYGYHLMLLSGLFCLTLIEWDGRRVPWTMGAFVLLVGLLAPLGCAAIRPAHFLHEIPPEWNLSAWKLALFDGLIGAAVGGCLSIPSTIAPWLSKSGRWNGVIGLIWVGAFLGWQAVAVLACWSAIAYLGGSLLLFRKSAVGRWPWCGGLAVGGLAWIFFWQLLVRWLPVLG